MTNALWFTLNSKGYCVRFESNIDSPNYRTGYVVNPIERVDFPTLIGRVAGKGVSKDFYGSGVEVLFDEHGELEVPLSEREAIKILVEAIEMRAEQVRDAQKRLEQIVKVADRTL